MSTSIKRQRGGEDPGVSTSPIFVGGKPVAVLSEIGGSGSNNKWALLLASVLPSPFNMFKGADNNWYLHVNGTFSGMTPSAKINSSTTLLMFPDKHAPDWKPLLAFMMFVNKRLQFLGLPQMELDRIIVAMKNALTTKHIDGVRIGMTRVNVEVSLDGSRHGMAFVGEDVPRALPSAAA